MSKFFDSRVRVLEMELKSKMELQLTDWVENLSNEQNRIGEQIRNFSEGILSNPLSRAVSVTSKGSSFRETFKASFRCFSKRNDSEDSSKHNLMHKTLRDLRASSGSGYFG